MGGVSPRKELPAIAMPIPTAILMVTPRSLGWGVAPNRLTSILMPIYMAIPMATPRAPGWGDAHDKCTSYSYVFPYGYSYGYS